MIQSMLTILTPATIRKKQCPTETQKTKAPTTFKGCTFEEARCCKTFL